MELLPESCSLSAVLSVLYWGQVGTAVTEGNRNESTKLATTKAECCILLNDILWIEKDEKIR